MSTVREQRLNTSATNLVDESQVDSDTAGAINLVRILLQYLLYL